MSIFARAPLLGRVKQRIAQELGDRTALTAHIHLVEQTLDRCAVNDDYAVDLCIADGDLSDPLLQRWSEHYSVNLIRQHGTGLGSRMAYALDQSLSADIVPVLIGSDCLTIDHGYVMEAFERLEDADVVLGPARDGGYGLIGLRQPVPDLFVEMPWGSSAVLEITVERIRSTGLRLHQLEPIQDVDTAADWRDYTARRG